MLHLFLLVYTKKVFTPERLKEIRLSQDKTQKEVAGFLKISAKSVANYENGKRIPGPDEVEALSKFFGVSLIYLMGGPLESKELLDSINPGKTKGLTKGQREMLLQLIEFFEKENSEKKR